MNTIDLEIMAKNTTIKEVREKILKLNATYYSLMNDIKEFEESFAMVAVYPKGDVTLLDIQNIKRDDVRETETPQHIVGLLKQPLPITLYTLIIEPKEDEDKEKE